MSPAPSDQLGLSTAELVAHGLIDSSSSDGTVVTANHAVAVLAGDTGVVDDPVRQRVTFPCQYEGCRRTAAVVEVSRRGQLYINDEQDIIYRIFPDAQGTIRITGFLPYTSFCARVPDLTATAGALRATDAAALHALNRTWVPFYCPQCKRSFCGEHWDLEPTFGWGFDHYSGSCPDGHPHFIDHC